MMNYFFYVPVYRCSFDKFSSDFENWKNMELEKIAELKNTAPGTYEISKNIIEKHFYPWYFNEVIGWISLFVLGEQIRGDYFFIPNKRINKGIIKKKFNCYGKAFEISIYRNEDSHIIFNKVRDAINELSAESPFKKRHIDLQTFDRTFKFVDWRKLLNEYK